MAVITKTLIVGGGGHYTSLATWESTEQANLIFAENQHVLNCSPGEEDAGTNRFIITGWSTDATYFVTIQGTSPCAMPWSSTATYTHRTSHATASNYGFNVQQAYTVIKNIQVHLDDAANCNGFQLYATGNVVDGMILKLDKGTTYGFRSGNGTHTVSNVLVWSADAGPANVIVVGIATGTFYNCMAVHQSSRALGAGFYNVSGTMHTYNCLAFNAARAGYDFKSVNTKNYCATDQASGTSGLAGSTGAVFGITDRWINSASLNFNWRTFAALDDAGANYYAVTTVDLVGVTRPVSTAWDIGVCEKTPSIDAAINVLSECLLTAGGGLTTNAELLAESSATLDVLAELLLSVTNGGVVNTEVWSNAVIAAFGLSAELLLLASAVPSAEAEVLLEASGTLTVLAEALLSAAVSMGIEAEFLLAADALVVTIPAELLLSVDSPGTLDAEGGSLVSGLLGIEAEHLLYVSSAGRIFVVFDYGDVREWRYTPGTLFGESRDTVAFLLREIRHTPGTPFAESRDTVALLLREIRNTLGTLQSETRE